MKNQDIEKNLNTPEDTIPTPTPEVKPKENPTTPAPTSPSENTSTPTPASTTDNADTPTETEKKPHYIRADLGCLPGDCDDCHNVCCPIYLGYDY